MHFIKNGFIAMIGMMIFFSCTGDGASVENAAKNICECTQPIVKINQEVQALQRAGKVDELTTLIEKTGVAFDAAVKCTKENVHFCGQFFLHIFLDIFVEFSSSTLGVRDGMFFIFKWERSLECACCLLTVDGFGKIIE